MKKISATVRGYVSLGLSLLLAAIYFIG